MARSSCSTGGDGGRLGSRWGLQGEKKKRFNWINIININTE